MAPRYPAADSRCDATNVSLESNGLYTFGYSVTVSEIDIDVHVLPART